MGTVTAVFGLTVSGVGFSFSHRLIELYKETSPH